MNPFRAIRAAINWLIYRRAIRASSLSQRQLEILAQMRWQADFFGTGLTMRDIRWAMDWIARQEKKFPPQR